MNKITPELISEVKANGASDEEIIVLENQLKNDSSEGKTVDVTSEDANVTSESAASGSMDSNLEDGSLVSAQDNSVKSAVKKLTPVVKEIDPYEDFLIKPEFFSKDIINKKGVKIGEKRVISEGNARKILTKKLKPLGISIEETGAGVHSLVFTSAAGEKTIGIGWRKGLWESENMTSEDKANALNEIIQSQVQHITSPTLLDGSENPDYQPDFDYDTYVKTYQKAINADKEPNVFVIDEDGGEIANLEDLSANQLYNHRMTIQYNVLDDYWNTDEGKIKFEELKKIEDSTYLQLLEEIRATMEIIPEYDEHGIMRGYKIDPFWAENAGKLLSKRHAAAMKEAYLSDPEIRKIYSTSHLLLNSMYGDDIVNRAAEENMEERYGSLANWNVFGIMHIGSFLKGYDIFRKEIIDLNLAYNGRDLRNINEQIEKFNNWDMKGIANLNYFETFPVEIIDPVTKEVTKIPINFNYNLNPKTIKTKGSIKVRHWVTKEGERFPKLVVEEMPAEEAYEFIKSQMVFAQVIKRMEVMQDYMSSQKVQEILNQVTFTDSDLWKDGKLNITAANWRRAMGDQAFRMLSSIFTAGMSTFVAEASGAYMEMLEGLAMENNPETWAGMDKDEKAKIILNYIETKPEAFTKAMGVGGMNMMLENVSNLFFVGKVAKPLAANMDEVWEFFIKGKLKASIQAAVTKETVKDMTLSQIIETITEFSQESYTQYAVGGVVESQQWSWDRNINAGITAFTTTPFMFGGGKTVRQFSAEMSLMMRKMRDKENQIAFYKKQEKALRQQRINEEISESDYKDAMVIMNAIYNMSTETEMNINDPEMQERMFEAQQQIEIERLKSENLEKQLEKLKEKYGDDYKDMTDAVTTIQELDVVRNNILKAEKQKLKIKRIDAHITKAKIAVNTLNNPKVQLSRPDGTPINYEALLDESENNQQSRDLLKKVGLTDAMIDELLLFKLDQNGNPAANELVMTVDFLEKNYGHLEKVQEYLKNGQGIYIVSNENVVTNINNGAQLAHNSSEHGFNHIIMETKTFEEIETAWNIAYTEIENSSDPQMKIIKIELDRRIKRYEKEFGKDFLNTEEGFNERWEALGDVISALSIGLNLDEVAVYTPKTKEEQAAWLEIANHFRELLYGKENLNESNKFGIQDILGFFSSYKVNHGDQTTILNDGLETNLIVDDHTKEPVIITTPKHSLSEDGGMIDLQLVRESANLYYKPNRERVDILKENERLEKKILEAETFTHEDPNIQREIRAGAKHWRTMLMFNNWGAFENVLKRYDKDKGIHSTINRELWNSENLFEFTKYAMQTWKPNMIDPQTGKLKSAPFAAYYFGSVDGGPSVAIKKQAAIIDKLDKQFKEDITDLTGGETIEEYQEDNTIDVAQQVEDYNERSTLVHTLPAIEFDENTNTGNDAYEAWLKLTADKMVELYPGVYDKNFKGKIRQEGRKFWKQFKDGFGGKVYEKGVPSPLFVDWFTKSAELIYNQLDQKTMNTQFTEFTNIISERMTAPEAKLRKDLLKDDIYSGTSLRERKDWNSEMLDKDGNPTGMTVGEAFIEKILKTKQIENLRSQGLSNAEIAKIIRADMVQESLFKHLADIVFKDAIMQATNNDAFMDKHGVDKQQIMQAAMMIDRGMNVKFSLSEDTKVPGEKDQVLNASLYLSSELFHQYVGRVMQVADPLYNNNDDAERVINAIQNMEGIPQDLKNFMSNIYDKDLPIGADEAMFTKNMKVNEKIDKKIRDRASNSIKNDLDIQDKMVENANVIVQAIPKELLDVFGVEFLGYKPGSRFLNTTKGERGAKQGRHYNNYINTLSLAKSAAELGIELDFDPSKISIINKATPLKSNGVVLEFIKLNQKIADGKITKKEAIKIAEESNLFVRMKEASEHNIKAIKFIQTVIGDALKKGDLNEVALIQMLKMQSNLVAGFRGLSRIDGFRFLDGTFKYNRNEEDVTWSYKRDKNGKKTDQKYILWKGEHAAAMSKVNDGFLNLLYDYKNGTINEAIFNAELDLNLAGYGQIIGHTGHFDMLDMHGATNITDMYRFNLLPPYVMRQYESVYGENMKTMQVRILKERELLVRKVNTMRKAQAEKNILLKNTTKGKVKGATVMDFDETIGVSENYIFATNPKTGETRKIPSNEWPVVGEQLGKEGWTFDFTDFNQVTDGKPGPLFQKLKNQIEKYGVKNVHILTARAPESATAIQAWLKSMGVNMPIENITGLGNSTGEAKAAWIEKNLIWNGFNDIYFVDDAYQNVKAVQDMFNTYPEGVLVKGGKSVLVEASKADTKNKVIFMIGGPGSGKSTIIDKAGFSENYTILNPDAIMEPRLKAEGLPLDISLCKTKEERSRWMQIMAQANKENKALIEKARQEGKGIIIDGTGASAKVMQNYIKLFTEAGYNVGAISVQTSLETALQRNADRERSLIDRVVIDTWDKAQMNIQLYKELFGNNFFQVHTDNMTMEDALPADFVRGVSSFTLTNPIMKYSLSETFNNVLETSTGIESKKTFSEAEGKIRGAKVKTIWDVIYPASAYDLEMFTYRYITGGTLGENQKQFFEQKLFTPFAIANAKIDAAKQRVQNDYKALIKEHKNIKKILNKNIEGTNFTVQQAVRVWLWNNSKFEIPGLASTTKEKLLAEVENNLELKMFAQKLGILSQQSEGYLKPSEYWTVETINHDLHELTGVVGRAEFLQEWKVNVSEIFSQENKNKLRAAFGNDHVEALEDMLYRMEYGRNRKNPGRIETQWNNWVNNSVGAIMFFNMRSAALQTISTANYIDWGDNSIDKALKAIANVPQFAKDFLYIMNSDMLVQRRKGLKMDVNASELAERLKHSTNKPKAIIAWLLEKGFAPTQFADSFAISLMGSTYYRNKIKAYEKIIDPETGVKYTTEKAQELAWLDFQEKTAKGQQSSRPDLISQQQASGLGRLILAFKNTPMQYNRLMTKSILDLKNNRGSTKENVSRIIYYGAVQNIIFTSLQTALWSALGSEDEWDTKKERVANGMIDSILNGMGLTGAIAVTVKNGFLRYQKEKKRGWNADHTRTIIEFANLSPTIGSKLRKLYSAIQTEQFNEGVIEEMGFTLENPAFNSMASLLSATTNIPLDRAVQKCQNLILASKDETEFWDSFALAMGWNPWDLGLESTARQVRKEVKKEDKKVKEKIKQEKKNKEKEKELQKVIAKEKKQEKEGKKTIFSCGAVKTNGERCSNTVSKAGNRCTVHAKVEQRKDGKETICTAVRTNGKPCNMKTTAKSGLCVYHD